MAQLELSIPVKQRRDVLDALDEEGIEAKIWPAHDESDGNRCFLVVTGGVKNVKAMVNAVLGRFSIPVESDAD